METSSPTRPGENPLYGMIGGIEETSASCEARSAPRSYPTAGARGNSRSYRERGRPTVKVTRLTLSGHPMHGVAN